MAVLQKSTKEHWDVIVLPGSVHSSFASGGLHVLLNGNVGQIEIVYCMDGTG